MVKSTHLKPQGLKRLRLILEIKLQARKRLSLYVPCMVIGTTIFLVYLLDASFYLAYVSNVGLILNCKQIPKGK